MWLMGDAIPPSRRQVNRRPARHNDLRHGLTLTDEFGADPIEERTHHPREAEGTTRAHGVDGQA